MPPARPGQSTNDWWSTLIPCVCLTLRGLGGAGGDGRETKGGRLRVMKSRKSRPERSGQLKLEMVKMGNNWVESPRQEHQVHPGHELQGDAYRDVQQACFGQLWRPL